MSMGMSKHRSTVTSVLLLAAVGLLVLIYQVPVWWVSLTAPNYPPEAFPDGVRIHFHLTGVESGCEKVEKAEVFEEEALDCVHEMDTINHYVGMYPIASGGVIETTFAPFLFAYMAVLLVAFGIPKRKLRLLVMGGGFVAVAAWMALCWLGEDGLRFQPTGRVAALARSLDQDAEEDQPEPVLSAGEALIAALKASLEGPAGGAAEEKEEPEEEPAEIEERSEKRNAIASLQAGFEHDQSRRPAAEREEWTGSAAQVLSWHHEKSLRRYFNDPEVVAPMSARMTAASHGLFWVILLTMPLLLACAWRRESRFFWLLIVLPMTLPVGFLADFTTWLWWYGHNLNEMGAFTLKPFMPTVFGDGKVAQFTTHSYPHFGFFLMLAFTGLLLLAAAQRRRQLQAAPES